MHLFSKVTIINKGQTLIEMVVALGLAIIIVGAIASLTVNGLRNASQSQNQTIATKLAQQAMDQVISSLKNPSCQYMGSSNNTSLWSVPPGNSPLSLGCGAGSPADGKAVALKLSPSVSCSSVDLSAGSTTQYTGDYANYSLDVWIADPLDSSDSCINAAAYKKITVHVNWIDSTGQHYAELISNITDN